MPSSGTAVVFLPDIVVREILLRLPTEPSLLHPRASLVCKRWHDLVTDPQFRRRYRAFHRWRPAPVLGVLYNDDAAPACRFIPSSGCVSASRFSPLSLPPAGWTVLGCYQDCVVLHDGRCRLLVWDPVFGDGHYAAVPLMYNCFHDFAAVLLAGDGDDDDAGFRFGIAVAFVRQGVAVGVVYSPATDTWSDQATATVDRKAGLNQVPPSVHDWAKPGAVVGDAVYWLLKDNRILKLRTTNAQQAMTVLDLPVPKVYEGNLRLRRTSDGTLGLAAVMASRLHLWAMETDAQGRNSWMLCRTVQLLPLLSTRPSPAASSSSTTTQVLARHRTDDDYSTGPPCATIIGCDEEGRAVFLRRKDGIFMLPRLHRSRPPEANKITDMDQTLNAVYPYANVLF